MIRQPLALLSFMFLVIAFARLLENKFDWIKKIGSLVIMTLLGMPLAAEGFDLTPRRTKEIAE